jgi:hypothetical protein
VCERERERERMEGLIISTPSWSGSVVSALEKLVCPSTALLKAKK